MGRTILQIAVEAAERDLSAPAPTTLFNTNDRVARVLRQAAKDTMREYLRSSRWMGLSEFHSTWVFSTLPSKFAYELPPDFLRIIPQTEQRNGWPLGLVGPATPAVWANWIYGGQAVAAPMGWRIKNSVLYLEPTPAAAELVAIEYVSNFPVASDIQPGDYDFTTRPPRAVSPYVSRDGWIDPNTTVQTIQSGIPGGKYDTATELWDEAFWAQEPEEILRFLFPSGTTEPLAQVRRAEFTADTDRCAFEDDYLLSLGMTFRLRRALGIDYAEAAAEYEEEKEAKLSSNDAGGARKFRIGRNGPGYDAVPLGDQNWLVS